MRNIFLIVFGLTIIACKGNKEKTDNNIDSSNEKSQVSKIVEVNTSLPDVKYRLNFNAESADLFIKPPKKFAEKNTSALFSGQDGDFAKFKTDLDLNNGFTYSTWIKPDDNNGEIHPIINRSLSNSEKPYYQFFIALRGEGYKESPSTFFCWFGIGGELVSLGSLMNWEAGNWYNLSVTYDLKTIKFYVNGKLQDQKNVNGVINPSDEEIYVAKHSKYDYYFNGLIDDFQVYNRSLSPDEVFKLSE